MLYLFKNFTLETLFFVLVALTAFFMPLFESVASNLMMLALLCGCFLLKRHGFSVRPLKQTQLPKFIAIFFVTIFFVSFFSINVPASLQKWVGLVKVVLPFLLFLSLKEVKKFLKLQALPVFDAFLLGTTCASLYAIYQFVHTGKMYVTAFYGHHAAFGSFIELSLPITVALLLTTDNNRQRLLYIVSGIICLIALILTQARGPWIAAFSGVMTVAVLFRHKFLLNKKQTMAGILVLLIIILAAAPLYSQRAATLVDASWPTNYIRVMIWQSALHMIHDYPLFGVGLEQFPVIYNPYYLNPLSPERYHGHAHNTYLTLAVECGLIGFTAFAALLISIFRTLLNKIKLYPYNPCVVACLAIFVALLVNSLVDRMFWEPRLAKLFWLFMGLMVYDLPAGKVLPISRRGVQND